MLNFCKDSFPHSRGSECQRYGTLSDHPIIFICKNNKKEENFRPKEPIPIRNRAGEENEINFVYTIDWEIHPALHAVDTANHISSHLFISGNHKLAKICTFPRSSKTTPTYSFETFPLTDGNNRIFNSFRPYRLVESPTQKGEWESRRKWNYDKI